MSSQHGNGDGDVDWKWCESCQSQFSTEGSYFLHIRGLGHIQKAEEVAKNGSITKKTTNTSNGYPKPLKKTTQPADQGGTPAITSLENWHHCEVCDLGFLGAKAYDGHVNGKYHASKLLKTKEQPKDDSQEDETDDSELNTKTYQCEVCDVICSGIRSYKMHLEGQKHLKRTKKLTAGGNQIYFTLKHGTRTGYRKLLIQTIIDKCKEPLIGLDYMTEFQRYKAREEPTYVCDLCSATMDPRQVINHVTGVRHRRRYLKFHNPTKHEEMCVAVKKYGHAAGTHLGEVFAKAAELREGRTRIRLKVEVSHSAARKQINDENVTKFDGAVWEEIGEDGLPCSRVSSGPVISKDYEPWSEGDSDYYRTVESDFTPGPRRSNDRHYIEELNHERRGLKRPSSEDLDHYAGASKRTSIQSYNRHTNGWSNEHYERNYPREDDSTRRTKCGTESYSNQTYNRERYEQSSDQSFTEDNDRERYGYQEAMLHRNNSDSNYCGQYDWKQQDWRSSQLTSSSGSEYRPYSSGSQYQQITGSHQDVFSAEDSQLPTPTPRIEEHRYGTVPHYHDIYNPTVRTESSYSMETEAYAQNYQRSNMSNQDYQSYSSSPQESTSYNHPNSTVADSSSSFSDHYPGVGADYTRRQPYVYASHSSAADNRSYTERQSASNAYSYAHQTGNQTNTANHTSERRSGATGLSSLGKLTKCTVKNEKDAEVALQVSNVLTKALAQYKLDTYINGIKQSKVSASGNPDTFSQVKSNTFFDGYSFNQEKTNSSSQGDKNEEERNLLADVLRKTSQMRSRRELPKD